MVAGLQGPDEGPGRHEGTLDGAAQLPGHVSEGVQLLHILRHAGHVHRVETVLRVQHLDRNIIYEIEWITALKMSITCIL